MNQGNKDVQGLEKAPNKNSGLRTEAVELVLPSDTTVYTCAVKPKHSNDAEFPSPENYNSNSDSSYEKYDNMNLDCNILDDTEPSCSNDLGQARRHELAQERIRACDEERKHGQTNMGNRASHTKGDENELDEGD